MISAKPSRSRSRRPDETYLELVHRYPLRPLRNDAEYDEAVGILNALAIRGERDLKPAEQDYLYTMTLLVQDYDERHVQLETRGLDGLDMLKYIMEQSGMKTADLGRLLGNRGLASLILNAHRALSKTHIRILAEHFKVDPGLYLLTK